MGTKNTLPTYEKTEFLFYIKFNFLSLVVLNKSNYRFHYTGVTGVTLYNGLDELPATRSLVVWVVTTVSVHLPEVRIQLNLELY